MRYDPTKLREQIFKALPSGFVVSEHTEREHFYRVMDPNVGNPKYPSVTAQLQVLKDEGLANFKMNRVVDYTFAHFKEFNDANVLDHLDQAMKEPTRIFEDAGDVGTQIHDYREVIFSQWISTGVKPTNFPSFVPSDREDIRAISALAALEKFVDDYNYIPVVTEIKVFDHKLGIAGTLDDLGLMRSIIRPPVKDCTHEYIADPNKNIDRCVKCDAKWKWEFVLMDLKSSNRFKDHYFFQVAMYFYMLRKLTGIKLDRCFILKVSKEDRTYKLEDLKRPAKLAQYAKHIIETNNGIEFIKTLRKDNLKKVADPIIL